MKRGLGGEKNQVITTENVVEERPITENSPTLQHIFRSLLQLRRHTQPPSDMLPRVAVASQVSLVRSNHAQLTT